MEERWVGGSASLELPFQSPRHVHFRVEDMDDRKPPLSLIYLVNEIVSIALPSFLAEEAAKFREVQNLLPVIVCMGKGIDALL